MWTKFLGVPVFRGKRFKYLTEIFRKIGSTLGGWRSTTPAYIKILTPTRPGKIISEVSGTKNKFLLPRWSEICLAPPATPKNGKISLGAPPVPSFKFYGPILCPDMGPVGLCHAQKFQHSLTPKGEIWGVKNFSSPFPPQNPIVKPPQNCVIMSDFVSPTNRDRKFGKDSWASFLAGLFFVIVLYKLAYMYKS